MIKSHPLYPPIRNFKVGFFKTAFVLLLLLWPAAGLASNPQSGSVAVNGLVPGPTPTVAAVITQPTDGQHFDHNTLSVLGTCPNDTMVEIYKNGIFAGVTDCPDGNFSLSISLVPGKNILLAKVRNLADSYGPDSNPISVYYDVPSVPATTSTPTTPAAAAATFPALIVTTDRLYIGTFINRPLAIKVTIIGGSKPYAVNTDWGDSSSSLLPRDASGEFSLQNTYSAPGNHFIKISVTDSNGQRASVQTLAVINGEVAQVTPTSLIKSTYNRLFESLLTIMGLLLIIMLSFYLGYEWRLRQEQRAQRVVGVHHARPETRKS